MTDALVERQHMQLFYAIIQSGNSVYIKSGTHLFYFKLKIKTETQFFKKWRYFPSFQMLSQCKFYMVECPGSLNWQITSLSVTL